MKTLKEFVDTRIVEEKDPETVVENQEVETLFTEDFPKVLGEQSKPQPHDPPAVLIMKRVSIRQFSNGQRVALYHIDKINKYVTVPFADLKSTVLHAEESVLDNLNQIIQENTSMVLSFADGSEKNIDVKTARAVLEVYNKLNKENKDKLVETAGESWEQFSKIKDFALKYSK